MHIDTLDDAAISAILSKRLRIALVGASANPDRPSHGVMRFLLDQGHDVVPVNPGLAGQVLLGQIVMATLEQAGQADMLDIFRAADAVGPLVDDAVRLRIPVIWMQLGVINAEAAARARAAGLVVVMDRCPVIEVRRLGIRVQN